MATPNGSECSDGILGWLWSLLGVDTATPAYKGQPQGQSSRRGGLFSGTPTYKTLPTRAALKDAVAVPVELPPTEPGGEPRNVTVIVARRE